MAFIDYELEIPQEYREEFPYIYNVSYAVGYGGCYNFPEDVFLVQYFLKKIWERAGQPPAGSMKLDGRMGKTTDRWIRAYQRGETMDVPTTVYMGQDGRVDRAHGGIYAPRTGMGWTILCLNIDFKREYPGLFYNLITTPDLPAILAWGLVNHTSMIFTTSS